jgi:hypothetical protein
VEPRAGAISARTITAVERKEEIRMKQRDMTHSSGTTLVHRLQLGGAILGYVILAASGISLLNVIYQAVRFQTFDGVVAALIGVIAVYCMFATLLIAFSRGTAFVSTRDGHVETSGPHGGDNNPGRPNLRLLRFDSRGPSETPVKAESSGSVSRAA